MPLQMAWIPPLIGFAGQICMFAFVGTSDDLRRASPRLGGCTQRRFSGGSVQGISMATMLVIHGFAIAACKLLLFARVGGRK